MISHAFNLNVDDGSVEIQLAYDMSISVIIVIGRREASASWSKSELPIPSKLCRNASVCWFSVVIIGGCYLVICRESSDDDCLDACNFDDENLRVDECELRDFCGGNVVALLANEMCRDDNLWFCRVPSPEETCNNDRHIRTITALDLRTLWCDVLPLLLLSCSCSSRSSVESWKPEWISVFLRRGRWCWWSSDSAILLLLCSFLLHEIQHNSLDAHIEIICIVTSAVVFQLTKDPATFLLPPSQGAEGCLLASRFEVAKKKSKNLSARWMRSVGVCRSVRTDTFCVLATFVAT